MSRRNRDLSDTLYANVRAYSTGEIVLRLGYGQTKTNSRHLIAERYAEWVSAQTKGAVRIELFPAEILGSASKMIRDTIAGTQDMVISAVLEEYEPKLGLIELPFLFESWEKTSKVLDGEIGADLAKSLPAHGLRLLAYWENGFRQITNNVRPIRIPQDMAGLRIRTAESAMTARTLEALGAVPVPLPFPKVYAALASGEIDGQENPVANIETSRLYEVQKYMSIVNYKYQCVPLLISELVWKKLTAEHQEILRSGAVRFAKEHRKMVAENEAALLQRLEKSGMEITRPAVEPFRAATKGVYDRAVSEYGADWVRRIVAAAK
jgi:tripartite ATP-independent transporter DctP family solute receptor